MDLGGGGDEPFIPTAPAAMPPSSTAQAAVAATRRSGRAPKPSLKRLASQFEEHDRLADIEEREEMRERQRRRGRGSRRRGT